MERMMYIYSYNKIDQNHLPTVKAEMQTLGMPTVRVYYNGDCFKAIDGSHRLRAAFELGLPVQLKIFDQDNNDDMIEHDIDGLDNPCTLFEVIDNGRWDQSDDYRVSVDSETDIATFETE